MKFTRMFISSLAIAGLMCGCGGDNDDNETKAEICDNTIDDDGDQKIDCNDEDCANAANCKSVNTEICDNTIDDDGDQKIDCDDEDCTNAANCKSGNAEICDNTIDDDGDQKIDCDDEDCANAENCKSEPKTEVCDNTIDDDGDQKIDCDDEDCTNAANCKSEPKTEVCDNTIDDDGDQKADCDDEDCTNTLVCINKQLEAHVAWCVEGINSKMANKHCDDPKCADLFPEGCPDMPSAATTAPDAGGAQEYTSCYNDNTLVHINEDFTEMTTETCEFGCKFLYQCEGGKCEEVVSNLTGARCKTCVEANGEHKFCSSDGNLQYCQDNKVVTEKCDIACIDTIPSTLLNNSSLGTFTLEARCPACDMGTSICKSDNTLSYCQMDVSLSPVDYTLTPKEKNCPNGCENGACIELCNNDMAPLCSGKTLKTCVDGKIVRTKCKYSCENGACIDCIENEVVCAPDNKELLECRNGQYKHKATCGAYFACIDGECVDDVDENHNNMIDTYEPNYKTNNAKDCRTDADCGENGFCDSFIGYKCSTRCTSDEQCMSQNICRPDGRCAREAFELEMRTCNKIIYLKADPAYNDCFDETGNVAEDCLDYTINWGDGTIEHSKDEKIFHEYAKDGVYRIKITGKYVGFEMTGPTVIDHDGYWNYYECFNSSDGEYHTPIVRIISYGPAGINGYSFRVISKPPKGMCEKLIDLPTVDIPDSTWLVNMRNMFRGWDQCYNDLKTLEKWDVSNVRVMNAAFADSNVDIDISKWNVSNVEYATSMFEGSLFWFLDPNVPDLRNWNVSKLHKAYAMFADTSFNQDLSG